MRVEQMEFSIELLQRLLRHTVFCHDPNVGGAISNTIEGLKREIEKERTAPVREELSAGGHAP